MNGFVWFRVKLSYYELVILCCASSSSGSALSTPSPSSPHPWPFAGIEFLSLFSLGNQCFIDLSVLFHPAAHQCFIDLSLIWISNWCRLEWQSFHIQEKQQPGLFLRTGENESLRRPCKSASTQIISSPENSDYFSFAELSRENFAILARIKLSTISRLSAQCWSILLHSTDKNWSSQKHIDTKLCSQNPFYKICTECQRPGFNARTGQQMWKHLLFSVFGLWNEIFEPAPAKSLRPVCSICWSKKTFPKAKYCDLVSRAYLDAAQIGPRCIRRTNAV